MYETFQSDNVNHLILFEMQVVDHAKNGGQIFVVNKIYQN